MPHLFQRPRLIEGVRIIKTPLCLFITFASVSALASEGSDSSALSSFVTQLQGLASYSPPTWVEGLAGFLFWDILLRIRKTERPSSLFYKLRDFFIYGGLVLQGIGRFLDRVLQNSNDKTSPPPPPKV